MKMRKQPGTATRQSTRRKKLVEPEPSSNDELQTIEKCKISNVVNEGVVEIDEEVEPESIAMSQTESEDENSRGSFLQDSQKALSIRNETDETEEKMDSDVQDTDSENEAPEGISLQEGKKRAKENTRQAFEAQKAMKDQKKKLQQKRQLKNREQHSQNVKTVKTSLIPKKIDQKLLELAALKNDDVDEVLGPILEQVNRPKKIIKLQSEPENEKIVFTDDNESDGSDEGFEEEVEPQIMAQNLYSVNKNKKIGNNARAFLQEHFFGDRLHREKSKKSEYKRSSKNKKDFIGKRKKV